MNTQLIYSAFLGFVFGIFSRSLLSFSLPEMLALLVVSFALGIIYRKTHNSTNAALVLCVTLFLLLFVLGAFRMEWAIWDERNLVWEQELGQIVTKEGVVAREPEHRETTTHLYVASGDQLLLVTTRSSHTVFYGDTVQVRGKLQEPEAFEASLGRTFNYEGYMHARGVSYMIPFAEVTVVNTQTGNAALKTLFTFKHAFMRNLEKVIRDPHVGLAEGLLLGVKQALGEEYEEAFVKTGITHIVVLSGYNIMLVTVFVMYVLSLFLPFRLRLVCGLVAIVLFAVLVGLSATVVRASIMASLLLFAKLTGRTYEVVRGLLIAGVVMLIFNPYLLVYDVGFQLSFVATLGLILLSEHLEKVFRFMPKMLKLREFLVATVAAQIFVMPILLYQIGEFSIVAVLVNVLVLPMVPVAMLLSLATGLIGFVSLPLSQVVGFVAYLSLSYILEIATLFAQLPFASFTVPAFPFVFVVIAYAALGAVLFFMYKRSHQSTNTQDVSSWTIIDESEVLKKQHTVTQLQAPPIFFR